MRVCVCVCVCVCAKTLARGLDKETFAAALHIFSSFVMTICPEPDEPLLFGRSAMSLAVPARSRCATQHAREAQTQS